MDLAQAVKMARRRLPEWVPTWVDLDARIGAGMTDAEIVEEARQRRNQAMRKWRAKKRGDGMVEVRVWVPAGRAEEVQDFAASLRE